MNLYRHKKTGGVYVHLMNAYLEADKTYVAIYRRIGATDATMTWVRPVEEFFDGRFEPLSRQEVEASLQPKDSGADHE